MSALIFCLPHAGGGGHQYLPWAAQLHPAIEWLPLDYPGHFARADEPLMDSLAGLACALGAEMLQHAGGRPFGLFGHSMGGALAFEVAHHLAAAQSGALRLLLISSAAPPQRRDPAAHASLALDDAAFVRQLVASGGLSPAAADNPALLRSVLPLIRHDYRLYDAHRPPPRPPLDVPLAALWGAAETWLGAAMPAWAECSRAFLAGTCYPGAHFYWQTSRGALLADIATCARRHLFPSHFSG